MVNYKLLTPGTVDNNGQCEERNDGRPLHMG